MITKQVTLSTGVTVTVAPVPQKIYDVIRMKYPDPPVPILESDKTATGEAMRYENRKDADYLLALEETERARAMAWAEALLLFGLPDVEVPKRGRCPRCQSVHEEDPGIAPYCCPKCLSVAQGDVDVNSIAMEQHDWEPPIEELAYFAPDWKPRKGAKGRTLDYIEWELLRTIGDHTKVTATITALAMVPEEAVDAIEDTFPSDVEVQGQEGDTD